MTPRLRLSALGLGQLPGRKIWKRLLFSKEEPTAPAIQMAFERKGNLLIPREQSFVLSDCIGIGHLVLRVMQNIAVFPFHEAL